MKLVKDLLALLSRNTPAYDSSENFTLTIPLKEGSNTEIGEMRVEYASKDSDEPLMNNVLGKSIMLMIAGEGDVFQNYVAYVSMLEGKTDAEVAEINKRLERETYERYEEEEFNREFGIKEDGADGSGKVH